MERLIKYFKPKHYELMIFVDKFEKSLGGRIVIDGEVLSETIKFNAVDLKILEVAVNGKKAVCKTDGEILTISDVSLGEAEVTIVFDGDLNENMQGAYLSTYEYNGGVQTIVATQFESHYAREAFPCIDEPGAKAEFALTLIIPEEEGEIVLSNMPEVNVKKIDKDDEILETFSVETSKTMVKKLDKLRIHTFETTPRMSTYLLAWVIGQFHGKTVKNTHDTEITTYCALNQSIDSVDFANDVAMKSLEFYDDNFGVPYPLKKLDQVALPDFEAGAMENWGLVTYRESMLLAEKKATVETRKSVALTVAHELSHQWFGDLVTMEWWDDLWLNESFASVMEYYAVDNAYPDFKIFEGFFTGDCFVALIRDAYTDVQSVHQDVSEPSEIATLFDGAIVYSKGAHLMLMLIRLMGWDSFCAGCREYFKEYKYKNTVGDDLWRTLSKHAEFNVGELMHAFIDRPGYPVITSKNGDFFSFSQKRFLLDSNKMPDSNWPLPDVSYDMSGHYVLNLTTEEFEQKLESFYDLSLEEKMRLLMDRSLLCRTNLAESSTLLALVRRFENEDSAAIWEIVAVIIGQLKIFFTPESDVEKMFKKFVRELVAPKLSEIGIETGKEDDENTLRLRAILLGLDFYAEDRDNLEKLARLYNDDYTQLDSEIRDAILDAKIYLEPKVLSDYLDAYSKEANPEIKADLRVAMTLSKDENVLRKMIGYLGENDLIKLQDQIFLFVRLFRNSKSRGWTFEWMKDNWNWIRKTMGDKSLDSYPRYTANIIQTKAEYEQWKEFFDPMRKEPALKRAIEIGEKEIKARLELINKDRDGVVKELEGFRS